MRDLSPSFLQNKGFVNYIYHVSKGSGVRQIGMGSLAKDKPTPRSGKTLIFLGETRIYVFFLRRSVTVIPPIPQLSVSTSSMITTVVSGFFLRTSTRTCVMRRITSAFCSDVASSRVILTFTYGISSSVSRGSVRRKGAAPLPRDAGHRPGCGRRSPGRRPASRARRRKEKTKRPRRWTGDGRRTTGAPPLCSPQGMRGTSRGSRSEPGRRFPRSSRQDTPPLPPISRRSESPAVSRSPQRDRRIPSSPRGIRLSPRRPGPPPGGAGARGPAARAPPPRVEQATGPSAQIEPSRKVPPERGEHQPVMNCAVPKRPGRLPAGQRDGFDPLAGRQDPEGLHGHPYYTRRDGCSID